MQRITINLLPEQFKVEVFKRAKFYKIQSIGIGLILMLIFLATLIVALRILQSQSLAQIQTKLTSREQRITDLKTTQASILLLKDRLTIINQYLGVPSKQVEIYEFVNKLLPSSITISSLSIDKSGNIALLVTSPNALSVDELIEILSAGEEVRSRFASISLDGLNRGKDGVFRLNITIKTKV